MDEQYLFPFFTDEIEEYEEDNKLVDSTEDIIYKDIGWDYDKNTPLIYNGDFLIVEGLEAVKSWSFRALQTHRAKFEIFTWDYGLDLESFVGKVLTDKMKIDLTKEITECLLENKHVINILDFEFLTNKSKVFIGFKIVTKYGEFNEEVKLDETIWRYKKRYLK